MNKEEVTRVIEKRLSMSEPLKNKRKSYELGFHFLECDVCSAVEWYKRYRDNPDLFIVEQSHDYVEEIEKFGEEHVFLFVAGKEYDSLELEVYNNWLFDLAFEDCKK